MSCYQTYRNNIESSKAHSLYQPGLAHNFVPARSKPYGGRSPRIYFLMKQQLTPSFPIGLVYSLLQPPKVSSSRMSFIIRAEPGFLWLFTVASTSRFNPAAPISELIDEHSPNIFFTKELPGKSWPWVCGSEISCHGVIG
jgi:hypothetical protein